jgi:hypothetical protein
MSLTTCLAQFNVAMFYIANLAYGSQAILTDEALFARRESDSSVVAAFLSQ